MKKSRFVELILVTGLLGSNSASLASDIKSDYSKPGYSPAKLHRTQDTTEKKTAHSGSFFHPGRFGFWGHHYSSGS